MKLIVYHIYCVNNYLEIVEQQVQRLIDSKLYEWCDKLEVTCVDPSENFQGISEIFKDLKKSNISYISKNYYEYWPLKKIWDYSQNNDGKVFYFHTKGVTNRYKDLRTKNISELKSKGIDFWKEMLEYFLIDNWKDCEEILNTVDSCGVTCNGGWYWGNFWWCNLEYIKSNPEPRQDVDRWTHEAWLNFAREFSSHEFFHFSYNPYLTYLPISIFKNPKEWSSEKIQLISAKYGTNGIQIDEGHSHNYDGLIRQVDVTEFILDSLKKHNYRRIFCDIGDDLKGDPAPGQRKSIDIELVLKGVKYRLGFSGPSRIEFKLPE